MKQDLEGGVLPTRPLEHRCSVELGFPSACPHVPAVTLARMVGCACSGAVRCAHSAARRPKPSLPILRFTTRLAPRVRRRASRCSLVARQCYMRPMCWGCWVTTHGRGERVVGELWWRSSPAADDRVRRRWGPVSELRCLSLRTIARLAV